MSYWDEYTDYEEFEIWTPSQDGTPHYIKILDWEDIKVKQFGKRESEYIETDAGWLRIDSKRLKAQLAQHKGFKGVLVLQRWVEEGNTRNTYYKVQKKSDAKEISNKRT
jgi:hypothetical protein